jgi:Nucleotidyl transferase AbiEii toxin, Type IV TA system
MKEKKNYAASVKQKLLNLARERRDDYQLLLTKFALERVLARISVSRFQSSFILKGAMLFEIWSETSHRSTRDLDFLSFGSNEIEEVENIFKEICSIEIIEDGLTFDIASLKGGKIKPDQEYEGVRVQFTAYLEKVRIPLRIDVGFGDVVKPKVQEVEFPTILDFPKPLIRTYPPETVIAEKFHALVDLGMTNSRLKDFYDLYVLLTHFEINKEQIKEALAATFEKRKTQLPNKTPLALTAEFYKDKAKLLQWKAFLRKSNLLEDINLEQVIRKLDSIFSEILNYR